MGFSFKNIKKNMQKSQQDPYFNLKFNYRMQRYFIYFIMGVIAITFISMVWNFKSSSTMGNVVRIFMVFIGFYLLYQIYSKTILPTKRILQHYEMSPVAVSSKIIDVPLEVDSILNQFDENGKRVKTNKPKSTEQEI